MLTAWHAPAPVARPSFLSDDYSRVLQAQRDYLDKQQKAFADLQYDQAIKQACGQYGLSK